MLTVEIHATSHIGRVRRGNEDNYLILNVSRSKAWTGAQADGEFTFPDGVVSSLDFGLRYTDHTRENLNEIAQGPQGGVDGAVHRTL